jgi:GTP cyclohydrolase II
MPTSKDECRVRVRLEASASLPTQFGDFRVHAFTSLADGKEHLALVRGEVFGAEDVPTRIHSECMTGDALGSVRCDCRPQLERALALIGAMPHGVVVYLRQEGRGIGLANKIRAYALQETGLDTIDANLALGFAADQRDYGAAVAMLRTLGVRSVRLLTNNPDKIAQLERDGRAVTARQPHAVGACEENRRYLETKARRWSHYLDPVEAW